MITKISGEQPFQVLTSAFSISPSNSGYNLEISADGVNYSPLFTVGAGVTRLVTGVAANSFYRLAGNTSDVVINWQKSCSDGGSGGGGSTYTAGEYISIDQDIISVTGITPDLYLTTADTQDFATEADITAATSPIEERIDDVERVTASALTELHNDILDLSGATPTNSPVIPAITSLAEYEAISGDVKTGDLIQVWNVDINGDDEAEFGLFEAADVQEIEDPGTGVITKEIEWERMDNGNSLLFGDKDYPWMVDNGVLPINFGSDAFLIAPDFTAEDEAYNGIGFDADGKPVITHIVPQYDEQTGEITGMTRTDTPIGPDDGSIVRYDLDREAELANAGYNTKLITQEYDENEGATLPTIVGYMEEGILNGVKIDGHSIAKVSGYIHQQSEPTPGPVFEFTQNDELATQAYVTAATATKLDTSVYSAYTGSTATAIVDLDEKKVESEDVHTIVKLSQAEYDLITPDQDTLYIIINNNQ